MVLTGRRRRSSLHDHGNSNCRKLRQNAFVVRWSVSTPSDGSIRWQKEVFRQAGKKIQIHKKNSHASPTPVLRGDHVFVHFGPAGTACLTDDGEVVWRNDSIRFSPTHGNGGSPLLVGDNLIITCDGSDQQFVASLCRHQVAS